MALATDDNIAAEAALGAGTTLPGPERASLLQRAERMRETRGGWLVFDDSEQRFPEVLATPREVAILVDRGCASSCERFLLAARQSATVTLYGDRSAGILDYGNVRSANVPGSTLRLSRPITRSKRLPAEPIDNVGIPVQVPVPADEPFAVEWVRRHMDARRR